ncbi:hypothetical protein FQN57_007341 [Myotisia sp. PD_48]|nr:hypothetical protein FQN57_007341 [Myotisia sp. PD_48]
MGLKLSPVVESDIGEMMEVFFRAFDGDPMLDVLFPGGNTPAVRDAGGKRCWKDWNSDPATSVTKCVDTETGAILGWAQWNVYTQERPEEQWKAKVEVTWNEGRGKEICTTILDAMGSMRQKVWQGKPFIWCGIVCCDPNHQRRGVGTLLMSWGEEQARKHSLSVYLEASPAGYPLYIKLGFKQVDTVVIKAEDWDGDSDRHYPCMVRTYE